MDRRGFISALCAAMAAPDPDKLLWKPGAKLISVPKGPKLIEAKDWSLWFSMDKNPTPLNAYMSFGIMSWPRPAGVTWKSTDVLSRAKQKLNELDSRYTFCRWYARDGKDFVIGEILRD